MGKCKMGAFTWFYLVVVGEMWLVKRGRKVRKLSA